FSSRFQDGYRTMSPYGGRNESRIRYTYRDVTASEHRDGARPNPYELPECGTIGSLQRYVRPMDVVLVALVLVGSVSGLFWFSRRLTGAGPVAGEFRRAAPATVAAASERVGTVVALTGVVRVGMTVAVSEATGRDYVARDLRLRPFDGASASATR